MSDQQATQEARVLLNQLLFGKQMTYCLSGVARLGVADHMNATPMAVEGIAGKTGAHAPSLYRVMRMLASMGVFKEEQGKRFALTPAGELLKSDTPGTMRYFAMMFGDEWTTRAYEHFTDCLRTGQDGVSRAYGQHVFDLLAERPEQSDTFQAAMTSSSTMAGTAVTGAYDSVASSASPMLEAATARCSPRSCNAIRNCKVYCSIAQRSLPAYRRTSSLAAKGALASRAAASSSGCLMAATPTS